MNQEVIIDCSGLFCNMLAMRLAKTIISIPDGGRVRVTHVGCGGKSDVEVWIRFTGHKLVEVSESDNEYEFVFIKRGGKK